MIESKTTIRTVLSPIVLKDGGLALRFEDILKLFTIQSEHVEMMLKNFTEETKKEQETLNSVESARKQYNKGTWYVTRIEDSKTFQVIHINNDGEVILKSLDNNDYYHVTFEVFENTYTVGGV